MSRSQRDYFVDAEEEAVLCFLETADGPGLFTAQFTTADVTERFHVQTSTSRSGTAYTLSLEGEGTTYAQMPIDKSMSFLCGRNVPPGTYTLAILQGEGAHGVTAWVADRHVGITGWQLFSRGLLAMVILAAIAAAFTARRPGTRQQVLAAYIFKRVAACFAFIVFYLAFHEGGHALAALTFGRFDFSRSDFWGLSGSPHSGLRADVSVAPWQRAVESFSGPMLPIVSAWLIFLWWRSAKGRRMREPHPFLDLMVTVVMCGFLMTSLVLAGNAMNIVSDGDWRHFIENAPGPEWAARAFALGVFALSAALFTKAVPHAFRCLRKP